MKNTTWQNIEPGQFVKFRYKGMNSNRSVLREVIVLDPRYRYRKKSTGRIVELFIGLEIDNQRTPALRPNEIKRLLTILGRLEDEGQSGNVARMKSIYKELKPFLEGTPIFKTYLLRNCRKYRVFHENKKADLNKYQVASIKDAINTSSSTTGVNLIEKAVKVSDKIVSNMIGKALNED